MTVNIEHQRFPAPSRPRSVSSRRGFTMLELLVALVILVTAFSIIWSTFSSTVTAWQRGQKMLDGLHHGDFVLEQLTLALRSAAFFPNAPSVYGFWLEDRSGRYPEDELSWVASGTAFVPADSPLAKGLYRVKFTIEDNEDGDPAVAVRAFPHLAEEEDTEVEPWFISTRVKGIDCRTYNFEDEFWEDEWEDTNSIPSLLEITLYMDPIEKYGRPITLQRLIELPVAPSATNPVSFAESPPAEEPGGSQPIR